MSGEDGQEAADLNGVGSFAGQRVLVTGGAGFIGSHLVEALLRAGAAVRVLDNLATGSLENLQGSLNRIEWMEADVRDPDACRDACREADVVLHLAALGSVPRSIADPVTSNEVNVSGTLNLLVAAREAGVRRLVYSSSSSVYGDTATPWKREDMRPNPLSPYAVSKLAGEEYCRAFQRTFGLDTVTLRYFNVFGPRQNPHSQYAAVIPRFVSCLLAAGTPRIYGDGSQSRDFTYVANVVRANLLAAQQSNLRARTFNIACGRRIVLLDVLAGIQALLGTNVTPIHEPRRPGDLLHSLADITAAEQHLGYKVLVPFEEGLSATVRQFRRTLAGEPLPAVEV